MEKGAKLGKKGARLDNKKVRNWTINLPPKKGSKLGKKGAKLEGSPISSVWLSVHLVVS